MNTYDLNYIDEETLLSILDDLDTMAENQLVTPAVRSGIKFATSKINEAIR